MLIRFALFCVSGLLAFAQPPFGARPERGPAGPPRGPRVLGAFAGALNKVVTNAPYSADAVTETNQVLADGNRIRQTSTARVYRDSEGRVRTEQSLQGLGALAPGGSSARVVFINDPVAGVNYALNLTDKTATKSSARRRQSDSAARPGGVRPRPQEAEWQGRSAGGPSGALTNVKTEMLGKQTIEGLQTEGRRTTVTIPAGQMGNEQPINIVSEQWYSPELETVVLSRHMDPRVGETTFRMTNISRSEPAASLFQAPSDFQVVDAGRDRRSAPPQK